MTMQVQKLCASKQGYAGACPPRPTVAAEAIEREYCYRLHSEWPLLDALHAQLDHLSAHERKKRLRLLQVCAALAFYLIPSCCIRSNLGFHHVQIMKQAIESATCDH